MYRLFIAFFILFSSSLSAEIVKYSSNGVNSWAVTSCTNLVEGDIFDTSALSSMCPSGKSWDSVGKYGTVTCTADGAYYDYAGGVYNTLVCDGVTSTGRINVTSAVCESPNMVNPSTGLCEPIPEDQCESGLVYDYNTESCVDDPNDDFCSEVFASSYNSCWEANGKFNHSAWQCNESTHDYSYSCDITDADKCYFGQPNYPDCLGNSDNADAPDSNYNPDTPNPITPDAPFDKSEPDAVTPTDNTDTAVLTAIQNMNRDLNNANSQLSADINNGVASLNMSIDQTNKNLDSIGVLLENSYNQDTQARQEALNFYGQNLTGLSRLNGSVNGVNDSLGRLNNDLKTGFSNLGDSLGTGFDSVNNTLGEQFGTLGEGLANGFGSVTDGLNNLKDGINGTVSTSACDTFSCDGSAAACYLAHQAWHDECAASAATIEVVEGGTAIINDLKTMGEGAFDENGALKNFYEESNSSMDEYLKAYTTENGFRFSAGCPEPRTYDLKIARMTLDMSPFCSLALVFRALLMAGASIMSLLMFAKHL